MLFRRKKQQIVTCVFNIENEVCDQPVINKDTLFCKAHHDEAVNVWPLKSLLEHKANIKQYKKYLEFEKQRKTKGAKKFEKELIDLLYNQENQRTKLRKKYKIKSDYLEWYMRKYWGLEEKYEDHS